MNNFDDLEEKIKASNSGFVKIIDVTEISRDDQEITYRVKYRENICGINGIDTEEITVKIAEEATVNKPKTVESKNQKNQVWDNDRQRYFDSDEYSGFPSHW